MIIRNVEIIQCMFIRIGVTKKKLNILRLIFFIPHISYYRYDLDYHYEFSENKLVGWLCLTSHQQRGHLETAPPFTVPCEGREAR